MVRPLAGLTVLDCSQFLSGPSAGLRMADLGARVIKIERPDGGDICRTLYISNLELDGESTLFHSINRNKLSYAVDLKNAEQREALIALIRRADVFVQNYRPGVIERLGLSYETVRTWNPRIVYGSISGYGAAGPWRDKPGQDLLVQSMSGLAWLTGADGQAPIPLGLSMVDMLAGAYMLQGILACLVRRGIRGTGGHVEVSMMDCAVDMQAAVWTERMNGGAGTTAAADSAAAELRACRGIFRTRDGYVAVAPDDRATLAALKASLAAGGEPELPMQARLLEQTTAQWLEEWSSRGIACGEVCDWNGLKAQEGFSRLHMIQQVEGARGSSWATLRCPIRIDGERFVSGRGSPAIGEHNDLILKEFGL
ncbi:CaiB/BaiF CoA transferase family protein [Cohnella sp. 56]|uniref:CaiB/BaiF CoA transferase family protein n=1 Tax=Cohnella sp. 56 TaxID=3113722 RepID=UPI0030E8803D